MKIEERKTKQTNLATFFVCFVIFVCFVFLPLRSVNGQLNLTRLIDSLQNKYNSLSSLSADFVQVYNSPSERTRRESGRLLLKKPGKMRWDYTSPERKIFLSDGKSLFEYVASDGYATRTAIKESDDMRAPFMFLLGRGNLRKDFSRIETARESPVHAGNHVLRMVPKRALEFRDLIIEVEPDTLRLVRLTFTDRDGARSDFLFSNIRENVPAGAAEFSLPKGVQVRD